MAASQPMIAAEVLAAHDFRAHRRLLDIGGGDDLLRQVARRIRPALMLFDPRPSVVEQAHPRFAEAGMAQRARLHGGDFHAMTCRDAPTPPASFASSMTTTVDAVRPHARRRACRLPVPGRHDDRRGNQWTGAPGAEAMGAAYFGL
jgi:demethylspheroidene O-methyltransferase